MILLTVLVTVPLIISLTTDPTTIIFTRSPSSGNWNPRRGATILIMNRVIRLLAMLAMMISVVLAILVFSVEFSVPCDACWADSSYASYDLERLYYPLGSGGSCGYSFSLVVVPCVCWGVLAFASDLVPASGPSYLRVRHVCVTRLN